MKKAFKKIMSSVLAVSMLLTSVHIGTVTAQAAAFNVCAGWYETLYAEWADSDPDAANVKVGYRQTGDTDYTYLSGDDLKYLVRKASTSGRGRVDIPGLKAGRYDIEVTASDNTVYTRSNILVYANDRSGYAHFKRSEGVGAYNNDGTPKDNAIIVYVTDENKNTVSVPGYEDLTVKYSSSSSGATWTRGSNGIGNILNNNHHLIRRITGPSSETAKGFDGNVKCDDHPLIFRFIGTVTPPENLTPYDAKTNELGGGEGDNGNLAITKYGKNITIEGIGDDCVIDGWGFTFSQTKTCPADAGESFEVRNLTFKNYPEDALGFQGDDAITSPIKRVWVHNNVFYPGYCANPTESDKAEGDGSCDFKRGQYYTMSYNHYIKCHKTNLLGASEKENQFYMTLHHNWYEDVASRQPLGAGGNIHIYNTYFQDNGPAKKHNTSQVIDLRGHAHCFSENNYFDNCKNIYNERHDVSYLKTFGDMTSGDCTEDSLKGKTVKAEKRTDAGPGDNGLKFPNGDSIAEWDQNPEQFYFSNGKSNVSVLNDTKDVPEYVKTHAGTLQAFPLTESGSITVTVVSGSTPITDADVTAEGITFVNNGDGTYTANIVPLGMEITVTASKEGYSSKSLTTTLAKDGDTFSGKLDLPTDSNGYAAVMLTGGSGNTPVTGVTVKLADGTVLADKGGGLYQSANEIAVGKYKVSITNTGDYVPLENAEITVRTTNTPTPLHLDKELGSVSVILKPAAGETESFDVTNASVSVGNTALTGNGSGTFTGKVEVGTPFEIKINVPGWKVDSMTSGTITAVKGSEVSVTANMVSKGTLFVWNYTDGTNTENFFDVQDANNWSSAKNNPVEYNGQTLNKAIKITSGLTITFEAPKDGYLTIVTDALASSSITLNGTVYELTEKIMTVPVKAGTVTFKRNKKEAHLYLLEYSLNGGESTVTSTESTTETTTASTSTETTTKEQGGHSKPESTTSSTSTETSTETTTASVSTETTTSSVSTETTTESTTSDDHGGDKPVGPSQKTLLGDANCDGIVNAADSAFVLQYVLNPQAITMTPQGLINSRVTKDGITAAAAAAILQKALLSTFEFEVERTS